MHWNAITKRFLKSLPASNTVRTKRNDKSVSNRVCFTDLRVPAQVEGSPERDGSPRRRSSEDDGEETDDDEPTPAPPPRSSMASTVAMVVVGGVAVWTALALS